LAVRLLQTRLLGLLQICRLRLGETSRSLENERLEKSCEFEVAKPSRRENALAAAMKRSDRR
jgi:hypothetical protein